MDLGIKRCEVKDLAGGDAALNASILGDVFGGAKNAVADALNLNAGVALAACEVAGSPQEGVAMAQVGVSSKPCIPRRASAKFTVLHCVAAPPGVFNKVRMSSFAHVCLPLPASITYCEGRST